MTALDPPSGSPHAARPDRALVRLWVGVLLPPLAWVVDFLVRTFAVRYANIHERRWPMTASTVVAVVLVLAGAALCRQAGREAKRDAPAIVARWGLGLAAFFLLLILAQAFPTLILRPREITWRRPCSGGSPFAETAAGVALWPSSSSRSTAWPLA